MSDAIASQQTIQPAPAARILWPRALVDAVLAVVCLLLTVAADFAMTVLGNPQRLADLQRDHSGLKEFLAKPFDLWTIGFAIIVGAALSTNVNNKQKVLPPAIAAAVTLVLILFSVTIGYVFSNSGWRILVPDLLGVGFVAFTLNRVKS